MLFNPHRVSSDPEAESKLVWSVLQSGTDSVLGIDKNKGFTIVDGQDSNAYYRSEEVLYCNVGRLVAVRRAAGPDPADLLNIIDFYDETGQVVNSLEIGTSPTDLVSDWTLDLDNNVYTVGDDPNQSMQFTEYSTNNTTTIPLVPPAGVTPLLDPRYIAFSPPDGVIIVEATRDPFTDDDNIYVFDTGGTYAQSRRIGDLTSSLDYVVGRSIYSVFVNFTGTDTEYWLLSAGTTPVSGWPVLIPGLQQNPDVVISNRSKVFIHNGTDLFKFGVNGTLEQRVNIGVSSLTTTMSIDQFNNIWITNPQDESVRAYRQNDLSLKWIKETPNVIATVGDYEPIGYKTDWN